jgi:hypothetical protein
LRKIPHNHFLINKKNCHRRSQGLIGGKAGLSFLTWLRKDFIEEGSKVPSFALYATEGRQGSAVQG